MKEQDSIEYDANHFGNQDSDSNGLPDEAVGDIFAFLCRSALPIVFNVFANLNEDKERIEDEIIAFLCFLCETAAIANNNDPEYIRYRLVKEFRDSRYGSSFSRFINNRVEIYHQAHFSKKVRMPIYDSDDWASEASFLDAGLSVLQEMIYHPNSKVIESFTDYLEYKIPAREIMFQLTLTFDVLIFQARDLLSILKAIEEAVAPFDSAEDDDWEGYDDN